MAKIKIAITLDYSVVENIDRLVSERVFSNRSRAIQEAVEEKLERVRKTHLARESAKLDPSFEKTLAEGELSLDAIWRNVEDDVYAELLEE